MTQNNGSAKNAIIASTPHHLTSARLDWIDALRGIAILLVILTHTGHNIASLQESVRNFTDYAARGVQLFFVVSAFTLFRTASVHFNSKSFYIRRFARIAPMFYLAIVFYAIGRHFGLGDYGLNEGGLATYLLLIPFLHGLSPYSYNSLVPGGWSVSCEFLFYYSLPLLAWFCRDFKSTLLLFCVAVLAAALWVRMYPTHIEHFLVDPKSAADPTLFVTSFNTFAFFYQLPVFLSGMLLVYVNAEAIHRFCAASKMWTNALRASPYLAVAILLAADTSGNAAAQSRTATIFVLFFLAFAFSLSPQNLVVNKAMILIGKYSYSMYLVHWVFLTFGADVAARFLPNAPVQQLITAYVLVAALSYMVAALTYRFVEDPFIKLGHGLTRTKPQLIAPITGTASALERTTLVIR